MLVQVREVRLNLTLLTQRASCMLLSISSVYMSLGPRGMIEAAVRALVSFTRMRSSSLILTWLTSSASPSRLASKLSSP